MDLFEEHDTLRPVIEAALEQRLGSVAYDDSRDPRVGRITLGCYAIFSGDANHPLATQWLTGLTPPVEILLPPDQAWRDLLDGSIGDRCSDRPMRTFASDALDAKRLARFAKSPGGGFEIVPIDLAVARQLDDEVRPHALQSFADAETFAEHGIGYAIIAPDGRIAAQSSSYAISSRRVEVAVGTRADYRRRGLARVVAAQVLLTCIERGLRPEWSAFNPVSKRLARSLGYRPAGICDIVYFE